MSFKKRFTYCSNLPADILFCVKGVQNATDCVHETTAGCPKGTWATHRSMNKNAAYLTVGVSDFFFSFFFSIG